MSHTQETASPGFFERFGAAQGRAVSDIRKRASRLWNSPLKPSTPRGIRKMNYWTVALGAIALPIVGSMPLALVAMGGLALANTLMTGSMHREAVRKASSRRSQILERSSSGKPGNENARNTDWAAVRADASHNRPPISQNRRDEGVPIRDAEQGVPQRNSDEGVPKGNPGNRKGSGLGD